MNDQRSLHPQYHDWGETFERRTTNCPLGSAALATHCSGCVCVCLSLLTAVCVHLDELNAEHKFQYGTPYLAMRHIIYLSFPV